MAISCQGTLRIQIQTPPAGGAIDTLSGRRGSMEEQIEQNQQNTWYAENPSQEIFTHDGLRLHV
jgi:hypothetical protein